MGTRKHMTSEKRKEWIFVNFLFEPRVLQHTKMRMYAIIQISHTTRSRTGREFKEKEFYFVNFLFLFTFQFSQFNSHSILFNFKNQNLKERIRGRETKITNLIQIVMHFADSHPNSKIRIYCYLLTKDV